MRDADPTHAASAATTAATSPGTAIALSQAEATQVLEAIRDLRWAWMARPSCQDGVLAKCRCVSCADRRAHAVESLFQAHLGQTAREAAQEPSAS